MSLKTSYSILAPVYDAVVGRGSRRMRRTSLESIAPLKDKRVLLAGVGTGLDFPHLSEGAHFTGVDITPAMLRRAQIRAGDRSDINLYLGDVMALPHNNAVFDAIVLHLILAVAPHPGRTLSEASRVLRNGGTITVVDKFLRPGQSAPLRRLLNPFIKHIATQTNIVFEALISSHPELVVIEDEALAPGGWFRRILLKKDA